MGSPNISRRDLIKRSAALGLIVVPAVGTLSACASGGGNESNQTKGEKSDQNPLGVDKNAGLYVVIFDGGFGTQYAKDAAKVYEGTYSKVELQGTTEIRALVQPMMVAGNPPDVINNGGAQAVNVPSLISQGQLSDLSPLLDAPSLDDAGKKVRDTLRPGVVAMGQFNSAECYNLNYAYNVFGMWYSQTALDRLDSEYPRTWDEMLAVCAKAQNQGMAGWTYAGQHPTYLGYVLYPFIAKIGGKEVLKAIDHLEPNAWKHDAVKSAFEAFHELGAKGYILKGTPGLDHIQSQTEWTKGKALFIPNGSWVESEAQDTTPAGFKMTMSPIPALGSSDVMPFETLWASPGESYIVPTKAKNAAGGMEYIRIMLGKESARNFTKLVSSLTCVQGAEDGLELSAGLAAASNAVNAAGDNVVIPRIHDWYFKLNKLQILQSVSSMMSGRASVEETLAQCQKFADEAAKDDNLPKYRHI